MMARILSAESEEAIQTAAEALRAGDLVVLPTDTVYGVAAALSETAIERIFAAKKRPAERAIPVLLADRSGVELVASDFPEDAQRLADAFWPGPLTLALPRRPDLPPNLSALSTVGVRVPNLPAARALIAAAGGALAVTSANRSDQPPACTVQSAVRYLAEAVAVYLDGGPCRGGIPSTVVTFDEGELVVVRKGPISEDALRQALR